jgi:hypothetical protein
MPDVRLCVPTRSNRHCGTTSRQSFGRRRAIGKPGVGPTQFKGVLISIEQKPKKKKRKTEKKKRQQLVFALCGVDPKHW